MFKYGEIVCVKDLVEVAEALSNRARMLSLVVLGDERFLKCSGSSVYGKHHFGDGGLLTHTIEVINLCGFTAKVLPGTVDQEVLFLAALWHDYGKCWDYTKNGQGHFDWEVTDHYNLITHINRSAVEWFGACGRFSINLELQNKVLHCILSHHGPAGPVIPQTKEAWILHCSDLMSARVNEV